MKNNNNTVRIVNDNDEVVNTDEVGIPGMISYSEEDIQDELQSMDSYRAEQNLWREDELGGIGLNFGDW